MTTPTARAADGPAADGSGKITRDAVLAAALEIIDRDGADEARRHPPGRTLAVNGAATTACRELWMEQCRAHAWREAVSRIRLNAVTPEFAQVETWKV
jgi:hypothetical protein